MEHIFSRPVSGNIKWSDIESLFQGLGAKIKKKWGEAMMNIMNIDGYKAIIKYDPVLDKFRGEFIGLNGGADFYATTIEELKKEGSISLKVFLEMCKEEGLNPNKEYSGTFNLRVPPELHAQIAERAAAEGKSLNKCVTDLLGDAVHSS